VLCAYQEDRINKLQELFQEMDAEVDKLEGFGLRPEIVLALRRRAEDVLKLAE
jgi:hypothetical protein